MNANTQSTINQGVKNSHPFTGIFREPIWQKAYVKNISLGYAAVIPLNFSEYFYLKLGEKRPRSYFRTVILPDDV